MNTTDCLDCQFRPVGMKPLPVREVNGVTLDPSEGLCEHHFNRAQGLGFYVRLFGDDQRAEQRFWRVVNRKHLALRGSLA